MHSDAECAQMNEATDTQTKLYRPVDRTSPKVNYSELNGCGIIYSFHIRTNARQIDSLH